MDRTLEIGSQDFKPNYICLITMKRAMRLLLVFPHRCFLEFSKNSKNSRPLSYGPDSQNNLSEFFLLTSNNRIAMKLDVFDIFIIHSSILLRIFHYFEKFASLSAMD